MTNHSGTDAARSYLTASIAVLGIGAMTLAPVQPLPDQTAAQHRIVSDLGTVVLASSFDPITPWVDTITTSIANIGALIGFALDKPFPILQTVVANLGTYLGELTSGGAGLIPGQIFGNIGKFFTAPFNPGEVLDAPIGPEGSGNTVPLTLGTYVSETEPQEGNSPATLNSTIYQQIASNVLLVPPDFADPNVACQVDGECGIWPTLASAANFLNTHASGVLLGLLGPVLSPVAALINSVTAIIDFVSDGDFIGAINEVVNIPANLVNGFLNGALLDLTPLLGALVENPPVDGVGFRLGGLISGPMPLNGDLNDPEDPPTEFSGGVGMDSVYVVQGTGEDPTTFPGLPIGPIGSLIGMGQYLSNALVVTPPEPSAARTAAAVDPVTVQASEAVEAEVVDVAEAAAPSVAEAAQEAEADNGTGTPSRAKARGARNAPAANDADSGNSRKSTPRGAAANRR